MKGKSKRILVLRDLNSNYIEEAILILKEDSPGKRAQAAVASGSPQDNKLLVKEAEDIISNYIRKNGLEAVYQKRPASKLYKKRNKLNTMIINAALIGSLAILAFFISRLF